MSDRISDEILDRILVKMLIKISDRILDGTKKVMTVINTIYRVAKNIISYNHV